MKVLAIVTALTAAAALGACNKAQEPESAVTLRVGIVAKSLGNGFFDAVHKGADEAAKELGGTEVIFTGPTTPTAEGQIEVINALVAQRVDAIAISANDPDALVPTLERAMRRGVKVVSFDSAVAEKGRVVHLAPSSNELIGLTCLELAASAIPGGRGKIAIVSATPTSTNQNEWIAAMKQALPEFPGLEIVAVAYGDDVADKSYRETVALVRRHTDLAAIVAPTSVGIVAAAKAIEDQGLTGRVFVTGLGLPSELAGHVKSGSVKSFAIWNPIDLGYAATHLAVRLARGENIAPGSSAAIGRMGEVSFGSDGVGAMNKPFVYDASNIEQYVGIF
ncbi:MAG: rhamnose ABC transporter substrate-binding protein [Phycisphaerae bacterium]|nr:rhamnose ABC transporter substrate-binding protein [Phycisphaerae bacterium]